MMKKNDLFEGILITITILVQIIVIVLAFGLVMQASKAVGQTWDGEKIGPFWESGAYWSAYVYDGPLADLAQPLTDLGYADPLINGDPAFEAGTAALQGHLAYWAEHHGTGWLPGCQNDSCVLMAPRRIWLFDGAQGPIVHYTSTRAGVYEMELWRWTASTVGDNRVWVIWVAE